MRRMFALWAALLVLIVMPIASATPTPRLGAADRASMYAGALNGVQDPVQVLGRACAAPRAMAGCVRIPDAVRAGIEASVTAPIVWVHRSWPHAGVFYVLGPIGALAGRAHYRFAWTDPAPSGCTGGGSFRLRLEGGVWVVVGGSGYEGCSVGASSRRSPALR